MKKALKQCDKTQVLLVHLIGLFFTEHLAVLDHYKKPHPCG